MRAIFKRVPSEGELELDEGEAFKPRQDLRVQELQSVLDLFSAGI